ncbi:MAG: class II fumarate hydratase [Oscillospiraceae bacterium]|nr:class II fumarate hydratase [Oscillospiraceae bacterium]
MEYRTEHDSMGQVRVAADKLWGAQTQRSLENFRIGTEKMPRELVYALAMIKKAAALANRRLLPEKLPEGKARAIAAACDEILAGKWDDQFPLSVWQTGSGTQTNMNVNEVLAHRASELLGGAPVHPNDDVNLSQSSNDVFPSAIHLMALLGTERRLLPALGRMQDTLEALAARHEHTLKTGRTHLMDATPMTFAQEVRGWKGLLESAGELIRASLPPLRSLPLGGTAVGTGLNAPAGFDAAVCRELSAVAGTEVRPGANKFALMSGKDAVAFAHGALAALAGDLWKIANDVRWLAGGPRCGLGELTLPANEPGSSIMPGKVNPTQCEALTMAALQVQAYQTAVTTAASQGNFQLNVFMPLIAYDYSRSLDLLTTAMDSFEQNCLRGIRVNAGRMAQNVERSLMLVTALSPEIGYERAAEVAQYAHEHNVTLRQACQALDALSPERFDQLVQPEKMV